MLLRFLSIVLVLLLSVESGFPIAQNEQTLRTSKFKEQIERVHEKPQVNIRLLNGNELRGHIFEIGDETFVLGDIQSGDRSVINYRDVASVRSEGLSKSAKIGIGIAIGVGVYLVIAVILNFKWLKSNSQKF